MLANIQTYSEFAEQIVPRLDDAHSVWYRLQFAVQSVHEQFDTTCKVMSQWRERWPDEEEYLATARAAGSMGGGRKASSAALLVMLCQQDHTQFLKRDGEGWVDYRERLEWVPGLGIAKAAFAACLLYPTEADVCCIDTHMTRYYRNKRGGKPCMRDEYDIAEGEVRYLARDAGIGTFIMQWAIWDSLRGKVEPHQVLRGV
jgi:hypothetical protein